MTKSDPVQLRPRRPCPICGKPSQQKFHPFCSARCAQIDLGRWLGGRYAVAKDDDEPEDERPEAQKEED
jgi:endogenous inhibitor of DNA gyrase (YacG/DUF329 family)